MHEKRFSNLLGVKWIRQKNLKSCYNVGNCLTSAHKIKRINIQKETI